MDNNIHYLQKKLSDFAFKESIPFKEKSYIDKDSNVKIMAREYLPFSKSGINTIGYSFNVDDCKVSYLGILHHSSAKIFPGPFKYSFDPEYPKVFFKYYLEDYLEDNIDAKAPSGCLDYYHLKELHEADIEVIKSFFDRLECFINVKFNDLTSDKGNNTHIYDISLCSTPRDYINNCHDGLHALTYTSSNTAYLPPHKFNNSIIIYDGNTNINTKKIGVEAVSILKHETLHALGLDHPVYTSYEENIKHRSLMEDERDPATGEFSPLSDYCNKKFDPSYFITKLFKCITPPDHITPTDLFRSLLKDEGYSTIRELSPSASYCIKKFNPSSFLKETFGCVAAPDDITPVDLYGLFQLFGPSENETPMCQDVRNAFVTKYNDYFSSDNEVATPTYLESQDIL